MSKNLVLGVSGSIAAYRAADLARDLMRAGWTVRVCLTQAASNFVTPSLFEALTGQPCLIDVFEEPEMGRMAHIDWARWADVIAIAPASASTLARVASGQGGDMLSTIILATQAPLVVAPAMNPAMYTNETTQAALASLRARGALIVEPQEGDVACGENGQGKLAQNKAIAEEIERADYRSNLLEGKKILITAGPTQEPIDSVRFLSNRSSGKMGLALARAAVQMGAEVTVVHGPIQQVVPYGVRAIKVRTALEMLQASEENLAGSDWVIGTAAVADYRPAQFTPGKLRRSEEDLALPLVANPDIIATLQQKADPATRVVAFAAEPGTEEAPVLDKLKRKGVFAIATNNILRGDIGFESENNELTLFLADGSQRSSGNQSKFSCAVWLWTHLVELAK